MWLYVATIVWLVGFVASVWLYVKANRANCDCNVVMIDGHGKISQGIPRASKREMGFFIAALIIWWPWFLIVAWVAHKGN